MRPIQIGMLGCVAVLCAGSALAQAPQQGRQGRQRPEGGAAGFDRGAFDPAQMQARMMERMKETLAATDEEWTVIEPRMAAVMEAQRSQMTARMRGGMRAGRTGPAGGGLPGFGGEPNPELDALQTALEAETPPENLKTLLENLRATRAKQQAALKKAQDELRAVLSLKQEATLVLQGTLE